MRTKELRERPGLLAALRLVVVYTAGRVTLWNLAGQAKAAARAAVMSELVGKRMPQSKSGVNALALELYAACGIRGRYSAQCEDRFRRFVRAVIRVGLIRKDETGRVVVAA